MKIPRSQIGNRLPVLSIVAGLLLSGSLLLPSIASAEIYGYLAPDGTFTYTNIPPPADAKVTDIIKEEPPLSPKAIAEASRESQINALNDRIRLLELENQRAKRVVVDYPAPPQAPAGVGCGPNGQMDCDDQYGPYYTSGLLYPVGYYKHRGDRDGRGHRGPVPNGGVHSSYVHASNSSGSSAHVQSR